MGIGGKTNASGKDVKFKNDISTVESNADYYYKPLDTGARMMAGIEMNGRFSIAVNASLGLINLEPKVAGVKLDSRTSNTGFGLSLGYRF